MKIETILFLTAILLVKEAGGYTATQNLLKLTTSLLHHGTLEIPTGTDIHLYTSHHNKVAKNLYKIQRRSIRINQDQQEKIIACDECKKIIKKAIEPTKQLLSSNIWNTMNNHKSNRLIIVKHVYRKSLLKTQRSRTPDKFIPTNHGLVLKDETQYENMDQYDKNIILIIPQLANNTTQKVATWYHKHKLNGTNQAAKRDIIQIFENNFYRLENTCKLDNVQFKNITPPLLFSTKTSLEKIQLVLNTFMDHYGREDDPISNCLLGIRIYITTLEDELNDYLNLNKEKPTHIIKRQTSRSWKSHHPQRTKRNFWTSMIGAGTENEVLTNQMHILTLKTNLDKILKIEKNTTNGLIALSKLELTRTDEIKTLHDSLSKIISEESRTEQNIVKFENVTKHMTDTLAYTQKMLMQITTNLIEYTTIQQMVQQDTKIIEEIIIKNNVPLEIQKSTKSLFLATRPEISYQKGTYTIAYEVQSRSIELEILRIKTIPFIKNQHVMKFYFNSKIATNGKLMVTENELDVCSEKGQNLECPPYTTLRKIDNCYKFLFDHGKNMETQECENYLSIVTKASPPQDYILKPGGILIFSKTEDEATIHCGTNFTRNIIPPGTSFIKLKKGCELTTRDLFVPKTTLKETHNDITIYDSVNYTLSKLIDSVEESMNAPVFQMNFEDLTLSNVSIPELNTLIKDDEITKKISETNFLDVDWEDWSSPSTQVAYGLWGTIILAVTLILCCICAKPCGSCIKIYRDRKRYAYLRSRENAELEGIMSRENTARRENAAQSETTNSPDLHRTDSILRTLEHAESSL